MPAYQTYFDHFFTTLPISRANFKQLGSTALTRLREARLGAEFDPHEDALQTALEGFDVNLTDADESTSGDTAAFRTARTQWLSFVDDTMKDYVTPQLRKLPVYADFKKYQKNKLRQLAQVELLRQSKVLLVLYETHALDMKYPELPADARAAFQQLADAHEERGSTEAAIGEARVALAADWLALARALRRLKAQLELRFEEAAEVYRFFDFGATRVAKRGGKSKAATT